MLTDAEKLLPEGYVPGKKQLELAAELICMMNDEAGWKELYQELAESLERQMNERVNFDRANKTFLRGLYYTFSHYIHQNRKDASDQDWQKTTAEMQVAIEFAIAHAADGNIINIVLNDQLEKLEYRALGLDHLVCFLENYRAKGLIPEEFQLPDSATLLKLTHEQMLELLTKLAKNIGQTGEKTNKEKGDKSV